MQNLEENVINNVVKISLNHLECLILPILLTTKFHLRAFPLYKQTVSRTALLKIYMQF